MAKWGGRVGSIGLQWVILIGLKSGLGQLGLGEGRGGLTRIFHIIFFLIKKITCICHLKSHATNYLM